MSGNPAGGPALILRTGPWAQTIAAARRRPDACVIHGYHWPAPLALHLHHIWPLGMGGPDVAWNEIAVCPTGHGNIHRILVLLHTGKPLMGTRRERHVAAAGYKLWVDAGRPGGRVTLDDS